MDGTITTAAEALRDEELHRTRVFIRLGWLASAVGLSALPFVRGDAIVRVVLVVALVVGAAVSFVYHQRFRDPARYGPHALLVLGVMCTVNTHVAILYFGALTAMPVFVVIGLYFVGRSEPAAGRAVYVTSLACHAAISVALVAGLRDPGVFATAQPLAAGAYVVGALYVQGAYFVAYYTGLRQRHVSLGALEQLQRETRIASQRAAVLDELRADLARARRGGLGHFTDRTVGGFRLGAIIGRGSSGEIYEGVAANGGDQVAVKVLHPDQQLDPAQLARLVREAKLASAAGSSHVVRVLAASAPGDDVPFIAMERLRGATLAEQLATKGQLTRAELVALVTQVGDGLDVVHAHAIVHRDLKPQNLFLDGLTWKIVDFGIARQVGVDSTLTRGALVGTPHYMAPEQAQGHAVDHRADLYSLAAIAYRALTGRSAFDGRDAATILYGVVHKMPVRPSQLVDVVEDVDRWCALALAKDPAARAASGKLLANQLVSALRGELARELREAADARIAAEPWSETTSR